MKIGVSSYSFSNYINQSGCDLFKVCDIAKEIGFDGIEFIDLPGENPIELAKKLKFHCEKIGLKIIAYTIGADFVNKDSAKEIERVKGCVDIAEALGVSIMRHDVCWGLSEQYNTIEKAIEKMVPCIREVTEYAESKGIKTCTENHGYIFQAPERVEAVIKAVDRKNYGWLCDIGNFLCDDKDPIESVKVALPYIFHVHAKDFFLKEGEIPEGYFPSNAQNGLKGTIVGQGVVPVAECINLIKASGYDGWFSLEFEGAEDNIPAIKQGFELLNSLK